MKFPLRKKSPLDTLVGTEGSVRGLRVQNAPRGFTAEKGVDEVAERIQGVDVAMLGNIYLDGKVQSRSVFFADGSRKTLGVMLPGEYFFDVGDREVMEITAGAFEVQLPGETAWKPFPAGTSFELPPNTKYGIRCAEISQYLCSYYK